MSNNWQLKYFLPTNHRSVYLYYKLIERFLHIISKPLLKRYHFYIKDTEDFINKIESHKVKNECILIAYDVNSMYTNMKIDYLEETVINEFVSDDTEEYSSSNNFRQQRFNSIC